MTLRISIGVDGGASNGTLMVYRSSDGKQVASAAGPGLNPWTQKPTVGCSSIDTVATLILKLVASATEGLGQFEVDVLGMSSRCSDPDAFIPRRSSPG